MAILLQGERTHSNFLFRRVTQDLSTYLCSGTFVTDVPVEELYPMDELDLAAGATCGGLLVATMGLVLGSFLREQIPRPDHRLGDHGLDPNLFHFLLDELS